MSAVESRLARARALARVLGALASLAAVAGPVAAASVADGSAFGPRVVEGDILVAAARLRGVGVVARERRWSHGEVPYLIDPTLEPRVVGAIEEAVARWNDVSGVTLSAVAPDAPLPVDHLHFQHGPGCASWVGRQGGRQAVWVGSSCTRGSVMHEIGHALGLEHEHTRPDRDQHVRVLWEHILPEKRHNFALAPDGTRALGDYDVGSIMHYGPANFSLDGRPTLEPLDPGAAPAMGQRDAPSAGDVAAVARLYASDLAISIGVDDERAAREVTVFVTNDHAQGAHEVRLTLGSSSGALEPTSVGGDEDWDCVAAGGRLECRLERLAGHATSRLVVDVAEAVDAASLRGSVGSKTPDLDPDNNRGDVAGTPALAAALRDPVGMPDDAAGGGDGVSLAAGSGPGVLLALALAGALRRRYWIAGGSPAGASPSFGIGTPSGESE